MPKPLLSLWRLVLTLALAPQLAFAHQPFESTMEARLQHNRLEVKLTMSAQSAIQLAGGAGEFDSSGDISKALLPKLQEQAGKLFEIRASDMILAPSMVESQFNKLGEWEAVVIFPEPAHGNISLNSIFLREMPLGYGGSLVVFDEDEKVLASAMKLSREQSSLAWNWPAPAIPHPPNPGDAKSVSVSAPTIGPMSASGPGLIAQSWPWLAGAGFGLILLLLLRQLRPPPAKSIATTHQPGKGAAR